MLKRSNNQMGSLKDLSKDIETLVETASKSVVRVDARRGRAGTGIVWDTGLVLTANHVVEQEDEIEVVADEKSTKAKLVGRDPATDLALLQVDGLSAPPMPRAKVEGLKPGQIVLAIGRPGSLKATFGTISAVSSSWRGWRGSEIEHLIQTNAPLYPGFSGGPLVDVEGRAVGMNSWVFGRGDGRAIAMDVAERVIASLRSEGRIKRPYLGIGSQEVPLPDAVKALVKQDSGLLIVAVEPQSPADKAGLMQGDTLVALDGTVTKSLEDLYTGLRKVKVGATQTVKVVRAGELKELQLTVGEAGR
jgi:serine protease DegQ